MKMLKTWFVYSCACVTTLAVFALCSALLAGVLAVFVSIWSYETSVEVFKNTFIVLNLIQAPITIICTIMSYRKEKKDSGS